MERDLNYWGVIAVPVGVLLCFGPALIAWIKEELSSPKSDKKEAKRP